MKFELVSDYSLSSDQGNAVQELVEGAKNQKKDQVLLGVTGSGKTFTMANIIKELNCPAMIIAHNKTLAAQLYEEVKFFFPNNAVEYFVSYYDYYQPEAYISHTDTYIEKDSAINERIDRLRHSATRALLERRDVVVVASVSCIYGLGDRELYLQMTTHIKVGDAVDMVSLQRNLVELHYERNDMVLKRGSFQVKGDVLSVFPSHYEDAAWRICFFGNEIEEIIEFEPLTGSKIAKLNSITIFANSHYVAPRPAVNQAVKCIKKELDERVKYYRDQNMILEAQRISQRTTFDMEMMVETGSCKGIENYSRYFSSRKAGEAPPTLFEYLPEDAILFIDESHVTVPQVGAMYSGDRSRKMSLVEHGFRLKSALDNRPLQFTEWDLMRPRTVYVSATPGSYERGLVNNKCVEQLVRPTGLIDPECIIRPAETQVDDLLAECHKTIKLGYRVLVTMLTKKMAEHLAEYMGEANIKVTYLHSDIKTLERVEIIRDLRVGTIDVLIGVNLLREGLDIPECGLVAILDADKEGFLRSTTSLIQTIGRAARNVDGRVLLYADKMTNSMQQALDETDRRREIQREYNIKHGITPKTVKRSLVCDKAVFNEREDVLSNNINELEKEMYVAADNLEFEKAAKIRNKINKLNASRKKL